MSNGIEKVESNEIGIKHGDRCMSGEMRPQEWNGKDCSVHDVFHKWVDAAGDWFGHKGCHMCVCVSWAVEEVEVRQMK